MPYDFIKPNKDKLKNDEDAKIQRELVLWQLKMREERQRRLLAAAEKAERKREAVIHSASHQSVVHSREESEDPPHPSKMITPLQEYRRELSEMTHGIKSAKNPPWYSDERNLKRRQMKQGGVTYHEARSVLREYIRRPLPSSKTPRRTPTGALQGYKDALALSTRLYDGSSCTSSSWHKKPLRSLSTINRKNLKVGMCSVATTRSASLRKRHTESIVVGRNADNAQASLLHRVDRNGYGGLPDRRRSQSVLEPKEIYQKAILEYQQKRKKEHSSHEIVSGQNKDLQPQWSESSFLYHSHRRCETQPMVSSSPVSSPQARQPTRSPYSLNREEPVMSAPTPKSKVAAPTEIVVSPPTPASNVLDNNVLLHHKDQPRRETSPLLTELLSKIVLPKPSLYRPDLFQGQRASDVISPMIQTGNLWGNPLEETTSDVARGLFSENSLTIRPINGKRTLDHPWW
ncbi:hypothetical protein LSM04_009642 [Trypanosoma melophagium]|uniref:uncharacterized protein n=1 Tax=Trypanosoma melophagium TaxID=715481 RepID=UPI00351AA2E9|nr:hypothetical protein LSM04_009642 [Trypanosoma melophagium]